MAFADYTLTELQTRLDDRIELSNFYTTPELTLAINEAIRLWNLYTGTWRRRITHALTVESDPYFALPQTMTFAMRMEADGVPLTKSSLLDLDYGRPGWQGETVADGGSVPLTVNTWAPVSLTLMVYWPKVVATGTTLTIDGVSAAPVLSAGGEFIDLNPARVNVLLDYAKHYLNIKRGSTELGKTMGAHKAFLTAAADENAIFAESSFFKWAMARDDKSHLTPLHAPEKV